MATLEVSPWETPAGACRVIPVGTVLRVESEERIKSSSLRVGDQLSAVLPHPLFLRNCEVLPAGTPLRLRVGEVARVKAAAETSRSWTRKPWELLFPRHQNLVSFRSSEIILADGTTVSFDTSLLDVRSANLIMTQNPDKQSTAIPSSKGAESQASDGAIRRPSGKRRGSALILLFERSVTLPHQPSGTEESNASAGQIRPDEVRVRLRLLQPLSATRNRMGQTFLARILEPLRLGNQQLIPEGSTIQGKIVQQKPPRRLRRAGQLRLAFGRVNLPDGGTIDLDASVAALEALRKSRVTLDKEGTIRASAATKKQAALDLGLAYVVGKVVDDLLEEGIKAGASAVATGTITTVARYVGIAAGTAFFFAHRGRDVVLPEYTELEIVVARPDAAGQSVPADHQGSD